MKVFEREGGGRSKQEDGAFEEKTNSSGQPSQQPGLNILVADDNPINRQLLIHMLGKMQHKVATAVNGKEALETLKDNSFDVVFMDVQMPVMDGLEATKAIRRLETGSDSHVLIIGLSASTIESDVESCLKAGMDDFIYKPIHRDVLLAAIDRGIAGKNDCNSS